MKSSSSDKRRILIIDDDEDILELLKYNFSKEGYLVRSLAESTAALKVINEFKPHLIILDLMMSPYNGIEVCRMIRGEASFENVYIFFLTAKSDQYYQHAVFNVGGDEFVEKIIGLKPLMSKVSTVLKENYIIRKRLTEIRTGSLELIRGINTVFLNGKRINLNRQEFEILFFLVQNAGKTISLKQLIKGLWGSTTFMDENSALNLIDNVRRKVGKEIVEERRINLFRVGSFEGSDGNTSMMSEL
jgi:two-component system, OmpR family, alkaline phosphatase synthesis response regulator PhoP